MAIICHLYDMQCYASVLKLLKNGTIPGMILKKLFPIPEISFWRWLLRLYDFTMSKNLLIDSFLQASPTISLCDSMLICCNSF